MSIAILCPTRGRPERAFRMCRSAYATAESRIDIWLGASIEEIESGSLGWGMSCVYQIPTNDIGPTAHKWNSLAEMANRAPECKLFMLGADDMCFATPGWDKALLDHYNALENKIHVYALQDSRSEDGTPHPIVTREYIEAMGYFVPPIFLHWYVDTWTVEIAKANGCFTHLKDYSLVHEKPSDHGQGDETHNRIRQWGWHERDKYVSEKCSDFLDHEKWRLGAQIYRDKCA